MGVSGFFLLVMARVAIKTASILCPDMNPDCEASRKLAPVCCWHFLITVFLIILPRNEMAIADIYRDNVSFLKSGKTTYFSKSLIGESQWLFPSLAGKPLLHCYQYRKPQNWFIFYGSNFLSLFLSFAMWIWDGMEEVMVSVERWNIYSLCGFTWSYQSCILMTLHRFQGLSLTL